METLKEQERAVRRFRDVVPSRQALYDAGALAAARQPSGLFTSRQLRDALAELGHDYAYDTVRKLLLDEGGEASGRLLRVRPGCYRLRDRGAGPSLPATGTAASHVAAAMAELRESGRRVVTRMDIEAALATRATPYSGRAVRGALLVLRNAVPPVVRAVPGARYTLYDAAG